MTRNLVRVPKRPRNREWAKPLKESKVYRDEREARLTQLAIETPTCRYMTCSDCCFLERVPDVLQNWPTHCPECDGLLHYRAIHNGEVQP